MKGPVGRELNRGAIRSNDFGLAIGEAEPNPHRMDQARATAISFMNFAKSYLETAIHVARAIDSGELRISYDAPVFSLFAHSLELQLKSALIALGMNLNAVQNLGHDISRLYSACLENEHQDLSVAKIEGTVRTRWKTHLRDARDAYQDRISAWVGSSDPKVLEEFGVFNNGEIGSNLPELKPVIQWLSERHTSGGSKFRYPKSGPDWHSEITAFGLNENVPLRTLQWACEGLDTELRRYFFLGN